MVGKSTVANAIAEAAEVETHIISFADPIRSMLQALGVSLSNLHDQLLKEKSIEGIGKSARELMQKLGTDWGAKHDRRRYLALGNAAKNRKSETRRRSSCSYR